jgi:hypothetical protein
VSEVPLRSLNKPLRPHTSTQANFLEKGKQSKMNISSFTPFVCRQGGRHVINFDFLFIALTGYVKTEMV